VYPYLRVDDCPIFRLIEKLFLELVESPVYGETSPLIRSYCTFAQLRAIYGGVLSKKQPSYFFKSTILEFKFGSNDCHVEQCDSLSSVDDNP